MNKVYQHGDELFVTFDATPRMRNLRTGLTVRPRVPFKYLGEMPQVGQVWLWESRGRTKRIVEIDGTTVHVIAQNGEKGTIPLVGLLRDHTLRPEPNFHFATGHKNPLNAKATDRRFTVAESLRDYQTDAVLGTATHEQMIRNMEALKQYCMADVEAEAKVRNSVGLYMSPIGDVFRVVDTAMARVILAAEGDADAQYMVQEDHFREFYKALPLPGQLWAKGRRYVTVDRVEDGRVYYTGGSSGLRRFLNEYTNVDTYALYKRKITRATFTGPWPDVQQLRHDAKAAQPERGATYPLPPRPFTIIDAVPGALSDKEAGRLKAQPERGATYPLPPRPFTIIDAIPGALSDKEAGRLKALWADAYTGEDPLASAWKKLLKKVRGMRRDHDSALDSVQSGTSTVNVGRAKRNQGKLEELARGYGGFTPTGRTKTKPEMQSFPNPPHHAVFFSATIEKLDSGTELEQLAKWARQLSLTATKVAAGANHLKPQLYHAANRVKELSSDLRY